jgi:hypothetical protein
MHRPSNVFLKVDGIDTIKVSLDHDALRFRHQTLTTQSAGSILFSQIDCVTRNNRSIHVFMRESQPLQDPQNPNPQNPQNLNPQNPIILFVSQNDLTPYIENLVTNINAAISNFENAQYLRILLNQIDQNTQRIKTLELGLSSNTHNSFGKRARK